MALRQQKDKVFIVSRVAGTLPGSTPFRNPCSFIQAMSWSGWSASSTACLANTGWKRLSWHSRVTQTERLRKFARLMNELMDPLQIVGSVGPGKVGEKRALAKLRSVVLRVIKQPLHRV